MFAPFNTPSYLATNKRLILELTTLHEEQRNIVTDFILSRVQRGDFISVIRTSLWDWDRIQSLLAAITRGHEVELLATVSNHIGHPLNMRDHLTWMPALDFLLHLIPSLPPDFVIPQGFDLFGSLYMFLHHKRNRKTWRKYSDALIFYLDHGGFDRLARPDKIAKFFTLCVDESSQMKRWSDEERTSESTRSRSLYYLRELDALAASFAANGTFPTFLCPESFPDICCSERDSSGIIASK